MMQAKWLWVGLAIAVATPAMAQPVQPAAAKVTPGAPASRAPKVGKQLGAKVPRPAAKTKPAPEVSAADVAALSSANLEAAAKAAALLGASDQPAAHDALLDALAMGLPAAVAVPAINALALHPAPPDVMCLKRYARHANPSVRSAAIGVLGMYPNPTAHAVVVGALRDPVDGVRAAAALAAARGRVRAAVEPLLLLLARGEESAARALAELADADLARKLAEQLGKVPEVTLALCLGTLLKRADFEPDALRVEVVHAIAKIQHPAATAALTDYIASVPKSPPRPSQQEASLVVDARLGKKKK